MKYNIFFRYNRQMIYCKHVYEYVHADTCPHCGMITREPKWHLIHVQHKIWKELNPDIEYSWWSI